CTSSPSRTRKGHYVLSDCSSFPPATGMDALRLPTSLLNVTNPLWCPCLCLRLRSWWRRRTLFLFQLSSSRCLPSCCSPLSGECCLLTCRPQFPSSCRFLACCPMLSGLSRLLRGRTAVCHCTLLALEHTSPAHI